LIFVSAASSLKRLLPIAAQPADGRDVFGRIRVGFSARVRTARTARAALVVS